MRIAGVVAQLLVVTGFLAGQERQTLQERGSTNPSRLLDDGGTLLASGTRIPLTLMNSISTRNAAPGDQVYLQTMVPVVVEGKVVIPPGTYVMGSVVESVRPGKVKGKGELALRFDSIQFADGQSVDLTGRLGAVDGDNTGQLDRKEGKLTGPGSAGRDAVTVGAAAATGTMMGGWIGDHGRDAGIGAGAGAAAGLAAVLLTRGPEATMHKGSTVQMVLNRDVRLPAAGAGQGGARRR
jgi:type IV secretion system protein VirB10